jgi:uncharacterized repeat protein (TIGR03803 family)
VTLTVLPEQVESVGGHQGGDLTLWSFGSANGSGHPDGLLPSAALMRGSDGAFHGTTSVGGTYGKGTVFSINQTGTYSLIYSFGSSNADGSAPNSPLIEDANGNYYGTTAGGGASNAGVAFEISSAGTESVLYAFGAGGNHDGTSPVGVSEGSDGNFYATTSTGGANGLGAIEKITPAGVATVAYSFGANGNADGSYPLGALVQGSADHIFYGTTGLGGANDAGAVFSFTLEGIETVLYSFGAGGATDGAYPTAALFAANDGKYYGTTEFGGSDNRGTLFSLTAQGSVTELYSFTGDGGIGGSLDGAYPQNGVIQASNGNFYGTTNDGGAYNVGTVFQFVPGGAESVIYTFSGAAQLYTSTDGAYPEGVVQAPNDAIYGVTLNGGSNYLGTVFGIGREVVDGTP